MTPAKRGLHLEKVGAKERAAAVEEEEAREVEKEAAVTTIILVEAAMAVVRMEEIRAMAIRLEVEIMDKEMAVIITKVAMMQTKGTIIEGMKTTMVMERGPSTEVAITTMPLSILTLLFARVSAPTGSGTWPSHALALILLMVANAWLLRT